MRFSSFVFAALASLTVASPILAERDAASISAAIDNINSKISIVNATVSTFKRGDLVGALKIQGQTDDVNKAVDSATKAASSSAPLGDDSITVGLKVLNGLQPSLNSLLANLVAHKDAFKNVIPGLVDVTGLVKYDLQTSKKKAGQFGDALVAKLDAGLQDFGRTIQAQIATSFDNAIAQFS